MKSRYNLHTHGADLEATVNSAPVGTDYRTWWLDLAQNTIIIHFETIDEVEQMANDILAQCTLWRGVPGAVK